MSDGLFVEPAFNDDDITVQVDQLEQIDMIELEPLENLAPPIIEHDLLTEFDQSMLFDAKDMVNVMNELRDMAMSQANYGANGDGETSSTWRNSEAKWSDIGQSGEAKKSWVSKLIGLVMEKKLPRKNIRRHKRQLKQATIATLTMKREMIMIF